MFIDLDESIVYADTTNASSLAINETAMVPASNTT